MKDLRTEKIILYGAGYAGLHFCELLKDVGISPTFFLDGDRRKEGKYWRGIEIKNFSAELEISADTLVIVCLLSKDKVYEDIVQRLKLLGVNRVVHMQEIQKDEKYKWLFRNQNLILYADPHKIMEYQIEYDKVMIKLEKDSAEIYRSILGYLLNGFEGKIDSRPIEEQYWAYDLFYKNRKEIVFDCGAYNGAVLDFFINQNEEFGHYYAFEPDKRNAEIIENKNRKNVTVIKKALSNKKELLLMRNYMDMNSVILPNGDFQIESMRLDEMGVLPTFIKIDVEGYEEKTLLGAERILSRGRPIIACAMYHSLEQLWKVPQLIYEMTTDYVYCIRSYMNIYETIFYAIPKERWCR